MSRMYFLIPNQEKAGEIVRDLRSHGVRERDIGVVGHSAALAVCRPGRDRGAIRDGGSATPRDAAAMDADGRLAGLDAALVPGGFAVGGSARLGKTLPGAAFGAWASSLVGTSFPGPEAERVRRAIETGEILVVVSPVDIGRERIRAIVAGHHPGAARGGERADAAAPSWVPRRP